MFKSIFSIAIVGSLFLTSCQNNTPSTNASSNPKQTETPTTVDEIVKSTATSKEGVKLEMAFNNTQNTATLVLNNETIELKGQTPASGIWYKNDHYELRGKGDDVELTKDGKSIFKSTPSVQNAESTVWIGSETTKCNAGVMEKQCLKVKHSKEQKDWELFYDDIAGFKYEKGYEYEIIIKSEKVENPPADASNMKYTLVKVVSKTKK